MIKKWSCLVLVLCMVSCSFLERTNVADKSKETQEIFNGKIGVLISNTSNRFYVGVTQAFQNFAKENSNIQMPLSNAGDNHEIQMQELDRMLREGVQAIVINMVDPSRVDEVYARLKTKNIPVVFFNRSPGQDKLLAYDKAAFVDGDSVQGGVMQGFAVLQAWKNHPEWDLNKDGKIQVAVVRGPQGNPSSDARTRWSLSTMNSYPGLAVPVETLAIEVGGFSIERSAEITKNWLFPNENDAEAASHYIGDKLEIIMTNSDTMALGVIEGMEKAGKTLPVFGIDGIPDAKEMVKEGKLAATISNDIETQAPLCIQVAINMLLDKSRTAGTSYYDDYKIIQVPYKLD